MHWEPSTRSFSSGATRTGAADAYLSIPFEMGELAQLTLRIIPPGDALESDGDTTDKDEVEVDLSLTTALEDGPPKAEEAQ